MTDRRFVFLGPPGAGKGTQAARAAERLSVPHISTGEILRRAVREGTELGRTAKGYMDRGALVPDDVVAGIVAERLSEPDCRDGFILDGFPRTTPQAEALDGRTNGASLLVLYFDLDDEEAVERLTGRRTCASCGANFHLKYMPPKVEGRCDRCGGELVQRSDDREETVRERLRVYHEQTRELVERYRALGRLAEIDANGSPEAVGARIDARMGDD